MVSFKQEMKTFISDHKTLCYCTAGVGVAVVAVGKMGQRLTRWVKEKHNESTRKTSNAAEKTFEENPTELRELTTEEIKCAKQKKMDLRKKINDVSKSVELNENTLNTVMKTIMLDISNFIPAIFGEDALCQATALKLSMEITIANKRHDLAFVIDTKSKTPIDIENKELIEKEEQNSIEKIFFDKALNVAQKKVEETLKEIKFGSISIQWNIFLKSTDNLITNRSGFGRYNSSPLDKEDEFVHGQDPAVSVTLINRTLIASNILDNNLNFVVGPDAILITPEQS